MQKEYLHKKYMEKCKQSLYDYNISVKQIIIEIK